MMDEEKYNFVKMYERSFRENWELPAVTDYGTDVTLTYGQLAINIEKLHILFAACGIKKNDKIAVMGKNNSNWVAVYLAAITYGAIIVPILQDFRANDALISSSTRRVNCSLSATSTGKESNWIRFLK